jgi:hypothetical protein
MELYGNINSIFNYYIFHMSLETVGQLEGGSPDVEELKTEDLDYETPDGFTEKATLAVQKPAPEPKPLKYRLLWNETKEQVGEGPYRSAEVTRTSPTRLGQVVSLIDRNRKTLAALGMVASLGLAAKQAKTLYEMHPFASEPAVAKQTPDPAKEILVPYTEIGGLNVPILAENCQGPFAPDCKINLGSGPRKFAGDEPVMPFPLELTMPKDGFLKTEGQPLPGNVGKYHYDPKKSTTPRKSGL